MGNVVHLRELDGALEGDPRAFEGRMKEEAGRRAGGQAENAQMSKSDLSLL